MKQLAFLLLALSLFSCQDEKKQTYSVISGTVENNSAETVLIRGNDLEIKTPISPEGKFSDTIHIKNNGFYQLYVGREATEIYLEKGKNLSLDVNADQFDETLKFSGDLANENNYLAQKYLWNEQNMDMRDLYSSEEDQFLEKLNSNQKQIDSLYVSFNISNSAFKQQLEEENRYSIAAQIEAYLDAHRYLTGVEDYQVSSTFYDSLKDINFKDTLAYRNSPSYRNLLDTHFNRVVNEETYASGDNDHNLFFLKKVDSELPDGYAKDKIMTEYLQYGLRPDSTLEEAFTIYKNSNPNSENLAKLTERYQHLQTITEGKPSPTFNYENHKGGTTSLADLKGKYVYIDVWATWCGPCLREIPALKATEKKYHNKNIEFVSISIDERKDYEKWKNMVNEKSLAGIQLFADNNWQSQFIQDYGILGIPRFILIDPEGNIVAADAPRPSDPLLREKLDELL